MPYKRPPVYVKYIFVRTNDHPALTDNKLVDVLPDVLHEELFVEHDRQVFVSHAREFFPLSLPLSPNLLTVLTASIARLPSSEQIFG